MAGDYSAGRWPRTPSGGWYVQSRTPTNKNCPTASPTAQRPLGLRNAPRRAQLLSDDRARRRPR
eukprot:3905469-Lingulodinium_polyedra.AAC.1